MVHDSPCGISKDLNVKMETGKKKIPKIKCRFKIYYLPKKNKVLLLEHVHLIECFSLEQFFLKWFYLVETIITRVLEIGIYKKTGSIEVQRKFDMV